MQIELKNAITLSALKDSFEKDGKTIEYKKATIAVHNEETDQYDVHFVKVHKDCPILDPLDLFDGVLDISEETNYRTNKTSIVKRLLSARMVLNLKEALASE